MAHLAVTTAPYGATGAPKSRHLSPPSRSRIDGLEKCRPKRAPTHYLDLRHAAAVVHAARRGSSTQGSERWPRDRDDGFGDSPILVALVIGNMPPGRYCHRPPPDCPKAPCAATSDSSLSSRPPSSPGSVTVTSLPSGIGTRAIHGRPGVWAWIFTPGSAASKASRRTTWSTRRPHAPGHLAGAAVLSPRLVPEPVPYGCLPSLSRTAAAFSVNCSSMTCCCSSRPRSDPGAAALVRWCGWRSIPPSSPSEQSPCLLAR